MRQIFSIRFFAAAGAVIGLFFVLMTVFATREAIEGDGSTPGDAVRRRIDLVDEVLSSTNPTFRIDPETGSAVNDTEFVIDEQRRMRIVGGTPGESHCDVVARSASCAVVADLLGEGVVWFALVPMGSRRTVDLPAIDVLDGGRAVLVNGWELPYAAVLDRRCDDARGNDVEFTSYREFRQVWGDDFTSIYSIDDRELTAVECATRVPYAPEPAPTTTTTSTSSASTLPDQTGRG